MRCFAFPTSILVNDGPEAFQRRRVPGCLYLRVPKSPSYSSWDDLTDTYAAQVDRLERGLFGRNVPEFATREAWVIETWFEHPHGLTADTARLLEREMGARHPFTRTFKSLVYDEDTQSRVTWEAKLASAHPAAYPAKGGKFIRPPVEGPDLYWRFCANPYWVQALLLARLMGGTRWTYVWGVLEALHGRVTDWQSLCEPPTPEPVAREIPEPAGSHHHGPTGPNPREVSDEHDSTAAVGRDDLGSGLHTADAAWW